MRTHSSCIVLQRPARPPSYPCQQIPHGILHFCKSSSCRRLHEEGKASSLWTSLHRLLNTDNFVANRLSNILLHAVPRCGSLICTTPKCRSMTRTTLRHVDRLRRQCTRFSDPAGLTAAAGPGRNYRLFLTSSKVAIYCSVQNSPFRH